MEQEIRPCLKIGRMANGERFFRQTRQKFEFGALNIRVSTFE